MENNDDEDEQITINQCWAGDKLTVFVRAILKACLCSMMLIAG